MYLSCLLLFAVSFLNVHSSSVGNQSEGAVIDTSIITAEDDSVTLRNLGFLAVVDLENYDPDELIELGGYVDDRDAVTVEAEPSESIHLQTDETDKLGNEVEVGSPSFLTRVSRMVTSKVSPAWSSDSKYVRTLTVVFLVVLLTIIGALVASKLMP